MTVVGLPVLLCAASRWESGPIASQLGLSPSEPGCFSGEVGDRAIRLVKTGMGPAQAALTLTGLSAADEYRCAMSVGFAGALQPGMKSGDLVMDVREADTDWVVCARETAQESGIPLHLGRILHSDEVVSDPAEKKRLGDEERASAVDMETQALRDWAKGRMPVMAVRVVLDTVTQKMPKGMPEDDSFPATARYAALHLVELPKLALLAVSQRKAMQNLCGFLSRYLRAF